MLKLLVDINTKFGSRLHVWQLRIQGPELPHTDSRVDTHQLTTRSIENMTRQKPYIPFLSFLEQSKVATTTRVNRYLLSL